VTIAWSTQGAALLAGAALPTAGWAGAVGAFMVAGLLYLLTAVIKPLGDWVARIPNAVASAMLAGVLLTLCVEPFRALADDPAAIAPVLVSWLVLLRFARDGRYRGRCSQQWWSSPLRANRWLTARCCPP
jgi:benzoate membrane transport protein